MTGIKTPRREVPNEELRIALQNEDNQAMIKTVTHKYRSSISQEDLHRCGLHGLWRALQYHQDGRGQKFTTSLFRFVDWECKKELKKANSQKKALSLEAINVEVPYFEKDDDPEHLRECLKLLPKKESQLVDMYYFRNMTLEQIGRANQYTKEAARQKLGKAIQNLAKIYTKE